MPHGVLFRAGDEGKIRSALLDDDMIEAVIGLGQQLFYGTGIPACILVLRPKGSKPADRQGKVLFINADRDYREGRAQNYLEPEHVEKIVSAFHTFGDADKFCRVVTRAELKENDDNLNIRRYVDTTPEPEPQDVRAHLHGGIPKVEVEAKRPLVAAHGFDPGRIFEPKDADYLQFKADIAAKRDLKAIIETDPGVIAAEAVVTDAITGWWKTQEHRFGELHAASDLVDLRKQLMSSFEESLRGIELLDHFAVLGIIAAWWGEALPDLKTLAALGYKGLIDAWVSTVLDALEQEKAKVDPLDHKVARALLPDYLESLASLEVEVSELDSTIKAATASDDEDESESEEKLLSPAEVKKLKSRLTATKKQLKVQKAAFANQLAAASEALDESAARQIVLASCERHILAEAAERICRHRRAVLDAFETWWDKYRVPLSTLEAGRNSATSKLAGFLKELGYE